MKALLVATVFVFGTAAHAAGAAKVCFGLGNAQGQKFAIEVSPEKLVVHAGTDHAAHPYRSHVSGRDGITYLEYKIVNAEADTTVLADENLSAPGSQGLLKIRQRDHGFDESVYFCRDR